jgi:hypothetical protein
MTRCWLCGDASSVVTAATNPTPAKLGRGGSTFSLGTLMFVITVIAVCLGVAVRWPPIGIPLSVVVVLGSIRALFVARYRSRFARPLDFGDKLIIVLASWFVAFGVIASALLAFVFTCFPIGVVTFDRNNGVEIAFVIGSLVAVVVAAGLFWLTRKIG